jgi:signal transduction histidine kinase
MSGAAGHRPQAGTAIRLSADACAPARVVSWLIVDPTSIPRSGQAGRSRVISAPDSAVAGAFFAVAVVVGRLAPGGSGAGVTRSLDAAGVLLLAGMTLPLALRRATPVSAAVTCTGCCAAGAILGYPVAVGAIGAILSLGWLAYVTSRRVTLAVGVPLGVVLVISSALAPGQADATGISSDLLIIALTLAVGDLLRFRDAQQALLRLRNQQLQAVREAETAAAVVAERMRIARDIHDAVGHGLVAITLHARAGKRRLHRAPDRAGEALDQIEALAAQALDNTRLAVAAVRGTSGEPAEALEPQPTLGALASLVSTMRQPDLDIDLRVDEAAHGLPAHLQLTAYRIVQESLSNAAKHARPAHVRIHAFCREDSLIIDVSDDGAARAPHVPGSGLVGMRERAAQCGGRLEAGPRPGGGWRVHADLPRQWQAE